MSGYVVCPACGSRIKAGRGHCLRCFELLPVEGVEAASSWWESLQLSQGASLIAGVLLTLAALLLGAIIWKTDTPTVDDTARPASSPVGRSATTVSTPASAPAPTPSPEEPLSVPVLDPPFLDLARSNTASLAPANLEAARTTFEAAVSKSPDDPEALNNLGQTLVRMKRVDEAIVRFERAAALAPNNWTYRFALAHAAGQLLQWDRAAAEYRQAAALSPNDYVSLFNLGMVLHKRNDDSAAIPEFEKAIKLAPQMPSFHVALGISLEKTGRIQEAVQAFQRFLELERTSPDTQKIKAHLDALVAAQQSANP